MFGGEEFSKHFGQPFITKQMSSLNIKLRCKFYTYVDTSEECEKLLSHPSAVFLVTELGFCGIKDD